MTAVLAAAAVVLTGCGAELESLPAPDPLGSAARYTVTAQFRDVENLTIGAKVKLEGVVVGDVVDISTKNYVANVKMQIEQKFPLSAQAKFQIRFTTPLGEDFVSVTSKITSETPRLRDGTTVRLDQTSDAPSIEDTFAAVSTLLNGGGLSQIHIIATELQQLLHGRTGQIRDLLTQLHTVVVNLDAHKGDIDRALDSLAGLTKQLNDGNSLIDKALQEFPTTIQLLSDDTGKLATLLGKVRKLGDTVRGLLAQSTDNMVAMLSNLQPTLDALRAADGDLIPTFKTLITFGRLFDRAAPGDYVNLAANILTPLESNGFQPTPGGGGEPNVKRAHQLTQVTTNGADSFRVLLSGGGAL
jgi:phospholipid/cholesterol/gamma-HCH transport system substrate-binding protein